MAFSIRIKLFLEFVRIVFAFESVLNFTSSDLAKCSYNFFVLRANLSIIAFTELLHTLSSEVNEFITVFNVFKTIFDGDSGHRYLL